MSTTNSSQAIDAIQAIDVHGHYGTYFRQGKPQYYNDYMTGDEKVITRRARESNIEWTVVSPLLALLPRGSADAPKGNREAAIVVPRTSGLLQWVVINPLQPETYDQAEEALKNPWCVGIKIHPEEHVYPIVKHGAKMFEFAAKHRTVILTHSSEENSMPMDFVPFADAYPEMKLILAHLTAGYDGDCSHQVRAIQASKKGNVFTDTSSAKSMLSGVIEWAVREVTADKILFGTDTPLYSTAAQRARINRAEISDGDKKKILSDNARKLLAIKHTLAV